jgi:phage FluMu protein Com
MLIDSSAQSKEENGLKEKTEFTSDELVFTRKDVRVHKISGLTESIDRVLSEIRCPICNKLLGKVEEGAQHQHKCPRCKEIVGLIEACEGIQGPRE